MNEKPRKTAAARVRMEPALKQRLEQLAMIQCLDVSDIIRMACMAYIARYQQTPGV